MTDKPTQPRPDFQFSLAQGLYWVTVACVIISLYTTGGRELFFVGVVLSPLSLVVFALLWKHPKVVTVASILQLVSICFCCLASMPPQAHESSKRSWCQHNLRQICLAAQN